MKTNIEITDVSEADIRDDGYADYTVTFRIGDLDLEAEGYCLCGWIAPGAHADLDGSGLELWGDSQPGGWSVCDGDANGGRLRVDGGDGCIDSEIVISNGCTGGGIVIKPAMIPEWGAAVDAAADLEDDDDSYDSAVEAAGKVRETIVERLEELCRDYAVQCEEPEADCVFEYLESPLDGIEGLPVRFGEYCGCPVLAWEGEDGIEMEAHPDPQSLPSGVLRAGERALALLLARTIADHGSNQD